MRGTGLRRGSERGFPGIRRMLQETEELNDAKFYLCRLRSDIWDLTEETLIPRWTGKWESLNSS